MNDETDNKDRLLQQSLADALGPPPLRDDQIERLFDAEANVCDDALLERIAGTTRRLLSQSSKSAGNRISQASGMSAKTFNTPEISMYRIEPGRSDDRRIPRGASTALVLSALSLLAVLLCTSDEATRHQQVAADRGRAQQKQLLSIKRQWMTARAVPEVSLSRVRIGDVIETNARERRRLQLPDGSVLYVNEGARVKVATDRRIELQHGEIYVEVVPQLDDTEQREKFEVVTPNHAVTALGTKFGVEAAQGDTEVLVTQGSVQVSGIPDVVKAGQQLVGAVPAGRNPSGQDALTVDKPSLPQVRPAIRASENLSWTRELMAAAAGALVPASEYAGGAIISVDPNGQEMRLSLRKYHVDVHIEDGFARTTIDHTYFNHTQSRLEGTFHFPLPPDASLSRLAMYVNGKLMEGGMAEREHARNTFEKIVHKMKDPALLEWVDGSTFKMRVFPLEPRQEKRIVLSYTQRLNTAYGKTHYRFPAGHSMDEVRDWSASIRVARGADETWHSPSHELVARSDGADLFLTAEETNSRMDRDLVLQLGTLDKAGDPSETAAAGLITRAGQSQWSQAVHEGHRYLMLRYRPDLPGKMKRLPRHWVFLFESSADRNPVLARTQIEIIRTLLDNAEHDDTFNMVTAGAEATAFSKKSLKCSARNIEKAISHLNQTHLIGALDLQKALTKCAELCDSDAESLIVHTGSAIPVLGEQDQKALLQRLPDQAAYIGVGVGRLWAQIFMKQAAGLSGGYFTQINPDEEIGWRAFELSSLLDTPRLLQVKVRPGAARRNSEADDKSASADDEEKAFLNFADTIVQGEQICAVARFNSNDRLPKSVTVTGLLNGRPWRQTIRVRQVADNAEYLPRSWAKLQIDRLLADDAAQHRNQIIRLSKSMYVMSPFTSLLVLENEEMYTQHNIDRGRKDHWALYPCPSEIQVVHEPLTGPQLVQDPENPAADGQQWQQTLRVLAEPQPVSWRLVSGAGGMAPASALSQVRVLDFSDTLSTRLLRESSPPADHYWAFSGNGDAADLDDVLWLDDSGLIDRRRLLGRTSGLTRLSVLNRLGDLSLEGLSVQEQRPNLRQNEVDFFSMLPELVQSPGVVEFELKSGVRTDVQLALTDGIVSQVLTDRLSRESLARRPGTSGEWASRGVDLNVELKQLMFRFEDVERLVEHEVLEQQVAPSQDRLYGQLVQQGLLNDFGLQANLRADGPVTFTAAPSDVPVNISGFGAYNGFMSITNSMDPIVPRYQVDVTNNGREFSAYPMFELLSPEGEFNPWGTVVDHEVNFTIPAGTTWFDTGGQMRVAGTDVSVSGVIPPTLAGDRLAEQRLNGLGVRLPGLQPLGWRQRSLYRGGDFAWRTRRYDMAFRRQEQQQAAAGIAGSTVDEGTSHRWGSKSRVTQHGPGFALPAGGLVFQPEFGADPRYFGDLMAHAPGLNTWPADQLAIAEQHRQSADDDKETRTGQVDPAARRLIEAARSRGWERVTYPAKNGKNPFVVTCDSAGRHVYDRIVSEGLAEEVRCDGRTLVHVYREIGLASERPYSRFHQRTIRSLVPWLLPSVDELASGADVVLFDSRTVAIVPLRSEHRTDGAKPASGADAEPTSNSWASGAVEVHLVFAEDGRLTERRRVLSNTKQVLWRTVYETDGTVRVVNTDGQEVVVAELKREAADAPELTPATQGLVVLPMPIRSSEFLLTRKPVEEENPTFANYSKAELLALILADMAEGNGQRVAKIVHEQFFEQGDRRDGLYVLLSRFPGQLTWEEDVAGTDGQKRQVDLRPSAEGSALRQFIRQYISWQTGDQPAAGPKFAIAGQAQSFPARMAEACNFYYRWKSGAATTDRTQSQIEAELRKTLTFVDSCRTDLMGWTLLSVVQPKIEAAELHQLLADAAARFEHNPQLSVLVREERVRSLFRAGKHQKARRLYAELLKATVVHGSLPRIRPEIRERFLSDDGADEWSALMTEIGSALADARLLRSALAFSAQLRQLKDTKEADRLLEQVLAQVQQDNKRPDVTLLVVEQLRQLADGRAGRLLDTMLDCEPLQKSSELWRYAAAVAQNLGKHQTATQRLEQAILIDFENRPDIINVERLRADYQDLMTRFEQIIDAAATLEAELPRDLFARIIRAADQWRTLEDDVTTCCHTTARLLSKINRRDLAWSYLTTPLAGHSGESAPWRSLARHLSQQQQVDLASLAWERAFEFEQTNPEILLEHANMLRANGRLTAARQLYRQITDSSWQPRFNNIQQQARQHLQ
ncbi:MAG: VIT domain-containing protein [Fuerstiella sp.]